MVGTRSKKAHRIEIDRSIPRVEPAGFDFGLIIGERGRPIQEFTAFASTFCDRLTEWTDKLRPPPRSQAVILRFNGPGAGINPAFYPFPERAGDIG